MTSGGASLDTTRRGRRGHPALHEVLRRFRKKPETFASTRSRRRLYRGANGFVPRDGDGEDIPAPELPAGEPISSAKGSVGALDGVVVVACAASKSGFELIVPGVDAGGMLPYPAPAGDGAANGLSGDLADGAANGSAIADADADADADDAPGA